MKKRILAFLLSLTMLFSLCAVAVAAIPYSPPANAWKDFGQQQYYFYEVDRGHAAPQRDGRITEADGYGKPVGSYALRYVTTVEKVVNDATNNPLPEYRIKPNGDYYVYPTQDSPQEVWDSISSFETDCPYGYIQTVRIEATSYSATTTYYYLNPQTNAFGRAYGVTADNFKNYTAVNDVGNLVLNNARVTTEKPENWEKDFAIYYTKPSSNGYLPVTGTTAPEWKEKTYYSGDPITVKELYQEVDGMPTSVATIAAMKKHHVILPERINVYARYDQKYFYHAIELVEPAHRQAYYNLRTYYGSAMSSTVASTCNAYSFCNYYRKTLDNDTLSADLYSGSIRTYTNAVSQIKTATVANILAKYGDPSATKLSDVLTAGVDYQIMHSDTPAKVPQPSQEEDRTSYDITGDVYDPEIDPMDDLTSGVYGTTVYEYRQLWSVINAQYNPATDASPVPEMFIMRCEAQLENDISGGYYVYSFAVPRCTSYLPGSTARGGGNYPNTMSTMRLPDNTGLKEDKDYGTYRFHWANIGNGSAAWFSESFVTDYFSVAAKKTFNISQLFFLWLPAGRDPGSDYAKPSIKGMQIRTDSSESQKIRAKIEVPATEKEIRQIGMLVAPSEVVRDRQLRLGMRQIAFYSDEHPVYYGVVDGEWVNLVDQYEKYFNTSSTPNESDSFLSLDQHGGKPSGLYTVYTIPVEEELDSPYDEIGYDEDARSVYTAVFSGANGEGLYNDFDDYFTFYTFRPYVQYEDGTVVYGEQEYKSVYYLACWTLQAALNDYNDTVVKASTVDERFNMDQMPLETAKDFDNNTITNARGETVYLSASQTSSGSSDYAGGAEYSIYWPERRAEFFRWNAVRLLSRRNNNTPLRADEYDSFHDDVKVLVEEYVQMQENIWSVIAQAESNRYVKIK